MAHRTAFIVLGCLALALPTTARVSAEDLQGPLALLSAEVTLAGTSNVHAYTASSQAVRLTRLETAPGRVGWDALVAGDGIGAFEIAVAAATLSSDKDGLDKNMHKALKASSHADIIFRVVHLDVAAGRADGVLQIAGVERDVTLELAIAREGDQVTVTGSIPLLMTDYGIKPPTAMLGMLKTDPKVTVSFEAVLQVPAA